MVVLALLLLAAGVAACVIMLVQASDPITISLFDQSIDTSAREIFLAGAVAGFLIGAGLWLLKAATGRARRKRQETKELQRSRRTEVERLEAEKAELENTLRTERASAPARAAVPPRQPAAQAPAAPIPVAPAPQHVEVVEPVTTHRESVVHEDIDLRGRTDAGNENTLQHVGNEASGEARGAVAGVQERRAEQSQRPTVAGSADSSVLDRDDGDSAQAPASGGAHRVDPTDGHSGGRNI